MRWAAGLGVAALVVAIGAEGARASDDRKLDRQIDVFERIVDDMLVESPNWLVQSRHETRGRYRSGQGARFTFDASLVSGGWGGGSWWGKWWKHGHDDDVIVIDLDDWEDMDDEEVDELRSKSRESRKKRRELTAKREERLYSRGKTEIIDLMMDFGELLGAVPDGEWLEIVADLEDAAIFWERDIDRLVVKAKMADLRAYAAGKIDEKKMVSRVVVEES